MRVKDMETFVALARQRHFGRAAEQLNTTQPAISARLSSLERTLGKRLVLRGDRRFELTPEGELVLQHFEQTLADLAGLRARLDGRADEPEGPLRIGAIDSVSSTWLPPLVDALREAYPRLKIDLTIDGTSHLVEAMRSGTLDISFCLEPVTGDAFRHYVACAFEMIWVGSPRVVEAGRTYSVAALSEMPIITFPRNSPPFRFVEDYLLINRTQPERLISCNSLYAIISLLVDGFGVGAIPTVTVQREIREGLLRPARLAEPFPAIDIVASFRATTDQAFIGEVVDLARAMTQQWCARQDPSTAWLGDKVQV